METAQVDVDDREASAKLLDLNAKLAELNRKVASPRITNAGAARAEAQIAALDIELDKLGDKTARPTVELKGAVETTAKIAALDEELDHLDDKASSAGPGGLLGKILGGAGGLTEMLPGGPAGLAAAVPAIAAILVEVTGLASGFAAAGAGAASFGLLAAPAVKSVETAYTALNTAQTAYQAAQAKYNADPTKTNDKAMQAALLNLKLARAAIDKLPASEQGAITGIHGLVSEFGKLSHAFEPQAFKVFSDVLHIANNLLPQVVPFANTFANVMDGLLGKVAKFTEIPKKVDPDVWKKLNPFEKGQVSRGQTPFQQFLDQLHKLEGPALNSIGAGIGKVAVAFGKLLTTMSGKDVAHAINIAFDAIAGTIRALAATVKFLMQAWDGAVIAFTTGGHTIASRFDELRHAVATWGHAVSNTFDTVRHGLADSAHSWASTFDRMRHDIAAWAADVVRFGARVISWFRALPGRILGAIASLPGRMRSAGVNVIAGLLNGLVAEGGRVISYVEHLASNIISAFGNILHIFSPSKVFEQHGRMIAAGLIQGMDGSKGLVTAAAGRLARATLPGGYPGGASGRGGQVSIQIAPKGGSGLEAQFWTWLKNGVREQGGDPGMFQRKVAFR